MCNWEKKNELVREEKKKGHYCNVGKYVGANLTFKHTESEYD